MPTGRYQSRFFSFLSEQSLKLRDKTSQTWRRMQIATAWGAQIVLYPIYLAFQTTRLVSRQLQQTVSRVLPQLRAASPALQQSESSIATTTQPLLTVDTPIQKTLQAIEAIIPVSLSTTSLASSPAPTVQSIASLLSTHALVLVTSENQVLDILTDDQQLQLQRRIIWEMATYWRQQRSLNGSPRITNFLPLPSDRPNAFLPIRVFYRLMTWMQTSPIALSTNLFQETQLAVLHVIAADGIAALPAANYLPPAQLPQSTVLPWLSLEAAFSGVFDRAADPSDDPSKSFRPSLWHRLQHSWQQWMQTDQAEIVLSSSPQPLDSSPQSSIPQAWLTWESLFGTSQSTAPSASDWELFDTTIAHQPVKQAASAVKSADGAAAVSISPMAPEPQDYGKLVVSEADEPEETALSTTWIEAEVRLVTYVKHPLEQVLEWLDRGMVWIEEKIANAVKWLRDRFNSPGS